MIFEFNKGVTSHFPFVELVIYDNDKWTAVQVVLQKFSNQFQTTNDNQSSLSLSTKQKAFEIASLLSQLSRAMGFSPQASLMLNRMTEKLNQNTIDSLFVC